jgi:CheY-like chemotaxis protein
MLTKNRKSRQALKDYLVTQNKSELLTCYLDLEEIRALTDEQALTRASALVWRYKTQFEATRNQDLSPNRPKLLEIVVWECLGRLRYVDGGSIEQEQLIRMINNAQNDLLAKLIVPFEGFLNSKYYKAWQEGQINEEKNRQQTRSPGPVSMLGSASITSRSESFSMNYSNVLVVDDSLVTLKLTRLTLEKDGHVVDKAMNGQVALDMLKQRLYDVVLIDLNMPVMDGFETIRLFREYERNQQTQYAPKRQNRTASARQRAQAYEANGKEDEGNVSDLSDDEALTAEDATPSTYPSGLRLYGAHGESADTLPRPAQVIIGMSTNVDDLTRKRALESGMDFFLPKPFTLQKFTEIIKISMQKHSAIRNSAALALAAASAANSPTQGVACDFSISEFENGAYAP